MKDLIAKITECLAAGQDVALATIISQSGSTPRAAGARMLILPDGDIAGTIGGGLVEAEVVRTALHGMTEGTAKVKTFDLNADGVSNGLDIICGGRLAVLIETIDAGPSNLDFFRRAAECARQGKDCLALTILRREGNDFRVAGRHLVLRDGMVEGPFPCPPDFLSAALSSFHRPDDSVWLTGEDACGVVHPMRAQETVYIFGAGHVSRQLARITRQIGFRTVVLDDREEFANRRRFEDADAVIVLPDFGQALKGLSIGSRSYIVIVTRGHSHDKTVLAQALKTAAGYIGMIGSQRKRDTIYRQLLKENFSQQDIERVHSPIGLSIGAETPEEIAVSIAAELIQVRAASKKQGGNQP